MGDTISLIVLFCGAIYGSFLALERVVSTECKKDIAEWLKGEKVSGSLTTWPRQFVALFDRVFGERHWSQKCFLRSCVASLIVMVTLWGLWVVRRPDDAVLYAQRMNENLVENLIFFFLFNLSWNMCTDFFALLACRHILGIMASQKASVGSSLLCAMLGTFASAATYVFVTVYVGIVVIMAFWHQIVPVQFDDVNRMFSQYMNELLENGLYLRSRPRSGSIGVYFYSALFTSFWAWLYFIAASCIRAARHLSPVLSFIRYTMDLKNRPLECIGVVAAAIAGVLILFVSVMTS